MDTEDKDKSKPGGADRSDEGRAGTSNAYVRAVTLGFLLVVVMLIGADLVASRVVTGHWRLEGQALFNRTSDVGALAWMLAVVVAGVGMVVSVVVRLLRSAWEHRDAGDAAVQAHFGGTGRHPIDGHGRTGAGPLGQP